MLKQFNQPIKGLFGFAGVGAPERGLADVGIPFTAEPIEIDKHAVTAYNAIHGTNIEPTSIVGYQPQQKDYDLFFHGSPCQGFSRAGKNLGIEAHHSGLLWESLRIIEDVKPKVVIWENVKGLLTKKHKETFDFYLAELKELGYTNSYKVLNSYDFGLPQNRERVFVVSTLSGKKLNFNYRIKKSFNLFEKIYGNKYEDILRADPKLESIKVEDTYMSTKSFNINPVWKRKDGTTYKGNMHRENNSDKPWNGQYTRVWTNPTNFGTIPATMGLRMTIGVDRDLGGYPTKYLYRWLTGTECMVAQGFTIDDAQRVIDADPRDSKLIERAGNSIAVPVLKEIFKELYDEQL